MNTQQGRQNSFQKKKKIGRALGQLSKGSLEDDVTCLGHSRSSEGSGRLQGSLELCFLIAEKTLGVGGGVEHRPQHSRKKGKGEGREIGQLLAECLTSVRSHQTGN